MWCKNKDYKTSRTHSKCPTDAFIAAQRVSLLTSVSLHATEIFGSPLNSFSKEESKPSSQSMGSLKHDYVPTIWLDPMWSIYGAVLVLSFYDKSHVHQILCSPHQKSRSNCPSQIMLSRHNPSATWLHTRIYSTKSPAPGAGNIGETMLMSRAGRVREVVFM